MQNNSLSHNIISLRSPTPPLDSSNVDLNDLDQELARLDGTEAKRPHFLDYSSVPPLDLSSIQLPIQSSAMDGLTNGVTHTNGIAKVDVNGAGTSTKKHFLDENPIPPDYDYEHRHHRSLDREYDRNGRNEIYKLKDERRHSIERAKQQKKPKESNYALLRFTETRDDRFNSIGIPIHDECLDKNNGTGASERLGTKVDCVYSLLSIIGPNNPVDISGKFLELSKIPGTYSNMRGCIPWLVAAIHTETDEVTRSQARQALHNVVYQPDDKAGRREAKFLRYIEQIMDYCDSQKRNNNASAHIEGDSHPLQAMSSLMKVSYDLEHRLVMCHLGGLQAIAALVQCDHAVHGADTSDQKCILLRRYAGAALTNLTFGDGNNKALLCANKEFMKALVAQIETDADCLLQVTANVLRNLSWRADKDMKNVLCENGTVTVLTKAAMKNKNENTLRAVLSALWNLSAHSSENKTEFLMVEGALIFLVEMLTYESPSKTLLVVENAGGILRNVSSHIAVNEEYRRILRQRNCLGILLQQLKSASLTIVSNACGTLWNLSARCPEDQKYLRANGAVPMLRSLMYSKHSMISNGSKAALKNLVNHRTAEMGRSNLDPVAKMIGLKELPTLNVRKQRAFEEELDQNLSETCENIDGKTPPSDGKSISDFIGIGKSTEQNNSNDNVDKSSEPITVMSMRDRNNQMPSKSTFTATDQVHGRKSNTGTIPKRMGKHRSNEDTDIDQHSNVSQASSASSGASSSGEVEMDKSKGKHPETDLDQITNFALLDHENHDGSKIVVGEDSTKCYENEGTPHTILSSAASLSDLHMPLRQNHIVGKNKHLKSGRNTTENSGINTPEKPIFYCEEGTPMYFSNHDSFSSLDEEHTRNERDMLKTQPQTLRPTNRHADASEFAQNEKSGDTMPTSPAGETSEIASKSVKFNELETPMMFSRQSSMESLSSIEPALADDQSSVVSEISRMPSGIISPSEIPDSPSQTMPQSPRRHRTAAVSPSPSYHTDDIIATNGICHLPFEEEQVKTYGVENTPAHISCATSLSNLSLDEETKITTDCLHKEMRLMHQLSDEQDDLAAASTSSTLLMQTGNNVVANAQNTSHNDVPSDSDDSVNDGILLATCINIGMKGGSAATQTSLSDKVATPPLSSPIMESLRDIQSSSDEDENDANDELLLQNCIRVGMQTTAKSNEERTGANESTSAIGRTGLLRNLPIHIKENPIGMMRKGGNKYIDPVFDKNFSVVSELSGLTIASSTPAVFNTQRLPSTSQEHANVERSTSIDSVDSEEDQIICNQAIIAGIQSTTNATITSNGQASIRLQQTSTSQVHDHRQSRERNIKSLKDTGNERNGHLNSNKNSPSSLPSRRINAENGHRQRGMSGNSQIDDYSRNTATASGATRIMVNGIMPIAAPTTVQKKNVETKTQNGTRNDIPYDSDDSTNDSILLATCINIGKKGSSTRPQINPSIVDKPLSYPVHLHRDVQSSYDEDDDENDELLLQKCIRVGMQSTAKSNEGPLRSQQASTSNSLTNATMPEPNYIESNHSLGSIDSNDSNVNDDELLQFAIKVGMGKKPSTSVSPKAAVQQLQRRSQLPLFKAAGPPQVRDHRQSRERKDERVQLDCINAGIERIRFNGNENTPPSLPSRRIHMSANVQQQRGSNCESQINDYSKNAYATSAAVLETVGATSMVQGVVMSHSHQEGTITEFEHDQHRQAALAMELINANDKLIVDRTAEQAAHLETGYNVCCSTTSALNASFVSTKSHNSFKSAHDSGLLEQSNEYPAIFGTGDGISDSDNSPSMEMDVSNEFLFENLSPQKMDKHKDPDLMLQSVERLTHDFVSTAEYLRTTKALDDDDDDDDDTSTLAEDKKSYSTSQNTWNEATNDVSFPSISRSVPIIASMKDDDTSNTDTNQRIATIEEATPTNECKTLLGDAGSSGELLFDIGGEINQLNFTEIGPNFKYSSSANSFDTNSTMTNSTIITMEANKIRTELMNNDNGDRTDSTISLDKIRPPSAMDKLSYCEPLSNGPSSLKTSGKYLTQGFMARRALNSASAHGSLDSINSSCNLDRVKPPSLMDELLDSMISVDSIASEFVDAPLQPEDPSHYETAHSECDDMTMTLKNCADLPMDDTPCGSDFSSVESTPKKSRRSLTPRKKREMTRDRYQTYTIVPDTKDGPQSSNSGDSGQFIQIHDSENTLLLNDDSDAISVVSIDDGELSSFRALTRKLTYLQNINTNTFTKKSSERFADLNKISTFRPELTAPKQTILISNGQSASSQQIISSNAMKTPRIVIPSHTDREKTRQSNNDQKEVAESKAIRGRKKPTYVSPYKMTKLARPAAKPVSPPVIKSVAPLFLNKSLSPRVTPITTKSIAIKSPELAKPSIPSIVRAKSLIQRSAESLRKIRPAITSKLTKQNSLTSPTTTTPPKNSPDDKFHFNRQQSDDTAHSSGTSSTTLIRQNTFTKDEPSADQIPIISSEPSSPKKTSKIATKIPFNRSVSATMQRNVTKCKTNIEIPLQKNAANMKRNMKSATSASHIMSPASSSSLASTPKQSPKIEQKSIVGDMTAGKNIFKRFSPLPKSNTSIQSKAPSIVNGKSKIELKPSTSSTSIPIKSKITPARISYVAK